METATTDTMRRHLPSSRPTRPHLSHSLYFCSDEASAYPYSIIKEFQIYVYLFRFKLVIILT